MVRPIRLASIGGGSTYTPDLADFLASHREELPVREWILMDIDAERLEVVGEFTRMMVEQAGLPTKVVLSTNVAEAVQDADFVITTMRVGLARGRILDETIPPKHGFLLGQETTAPGGQAMGLRTIPVILDVARQMERRASPAAWLINLANPSGMLAEALSRHSHVNFAGLCNGPTVARQAIEGTYAASPQRPFIKIVGLNHLIWCKVHLDGQDVTLATMDKLDRWFDANIPVLRAEATPLAIQRFIGWIPMGPYLRFYYELPESIAANANTEDVWPITLDLVRRKLGGLLDDVADADVPTRAHMVAILDQKTIELYRRRDMSGYHLVRNTRGGRGYGEAGLSLASAIWNDKNEIHHPDVVHHGAIEGLDPTVVTTTTALVNKAGIHPLTVGSLPGHMMSFIQAAKHYELLSVEAAVTGSYRAALEGLVANPLVVSYEAAKGALDELLLAHKEYLPQFSNAISQLEAGEDPIRGAAPTAALAVG